MLMLFAGSKLPCTRCSVSRLFFPECIFTVLEVSATFPLLLSQPPLHVPSELMPPTFPRLRVSPLCVPAGPCKMAAGCVWVQQMCCAWGCGGGAPTLQAEPPPPKHNQPCLRDTGTLWGLQPCKCLHTPSPLCLIKAFSSTRGKKQVISVILLPPKLLCALESPVLALLSLTFPLCKTGVQLCQCFEVYK